MLNKIEIATATITKQSLEYIENEQAGSTIMRANFLASISTHLPYPINDLKKHIINPKISYAESAQNTTAPVRSLIEGLAITQFTNTFNEYIERVQLTNDTVKVISNNEKENSNPDAIVTFKTNIDSRTVTKPMDVKRTTLDDDYLREHLREINVYQNQIVEYPNSHKITLPDYYFSMFNKLIGKLTMADIKKTMGANELSLYEKKTEYFNSLITCNGDQNLLLKKHVELQNTLMEINTLPGFTRTPTFIHIHYMQDTALTEPEMKFLEYMANKTDINTLSKESYMTNYLIESLKIYRELYDNKTYYNIKPLVKIYPWIKRGLGDIIPKDFYT